MTRGSKGPFTPREERIRRDAFYGGYCCALSAAIWRGESGNATEYLDAIACVDQNEILAYARRHQDPELPRIRVAIRELKRREEASREMAALRSKGSVA